MHQLFKLLEFNLEQLLHYCIMKYDDELIMINGETVNFYAINGLVINIVSSAKTLYRSTREVLCNGIRRRKKR